MHVHAAPATEAPEYAGIDAVIERFGASYMARYGSSMVAEQHRALQQMQRCRTAALGGHVHGCPKCRDVDFSYHSCNHRACPKCSGSSNASWLEERSHELLPVPYAHVVVTVPSELRSAIYTHQRKLYPVLVSAAAQSLQRVMKARYGVQVGVMAVLHTWSRLLVYHPHVHLVVTSGGLTPAGDWKSVTIEAKGLSRQLEEAFRPAFMRCARAAVDGLQVPGYTDHRKWHVFVDEARGNTTQVLGYLARYVHRTALSDRRIVSIDGDTVSIRYTPSGSKVSQLLKLHGHEFLRRLLQHVPPKGLHRVRYYGLWSRRKLDQLQELRKRLFAAQGRAVPEPDPVDPTQTWRCCTKCGEGIRVSIAFFTAGTDVNALIERYFTGREPPLALAA